MDRQRTILLVDDNFMNRRLVAAMLHGKPYRLIERESGREGLACALAQRDELDLLLLDVGMPDLTGTELCRRFREAEEAGRRRPVIAYTAHAMADERQAFLVAGFSDILIKPITREELLALLARHLPPGEPAKEQP